MSFRTIWEAFFVQKRISSGNLDSWFGLMARFEIEYAGTNDAEITQDKYLKMWFRLKKEILDRHHEKHGNLGCKQIAIIMAKIQQDFS